MKNSLQKSENLSLVPNDGRTGNLETDKVRILRNPSNGWLNSVAPILVQSTTPEEQPNIADRLRRITLTLTEERRVHFATVREGTEHRHWPPEVVLSFLAADVIKRKR